MKQLPVLSPLVYAERRGWTGGQVLGEWISSRVLELAYTSRELDGFARDLGFAGEPFGWDARRRLEVRCELDAAFLHLYGLGRGEAEHILGTFPIVERKERARWGEFLSRRLILERFEAMGA